MKKGLIFLSLTLLVACNTYKDLPKIKGPRDWKVQRIEASPQQLDGDPQAGLEYLIYGDYLGSGIPYDFIKKRLAKNKDTVLKREGENANVEYIANVFTAPNGVKVLNGNCFTCHAATLNGEMFLGLGDSYSDYRKSLTQEGMLLNLAMNVKYKKSSPEYQAYEDFGYFFREMAPHI